MKRKLGLKFVLMLLLLGLNSPQGIIAQTVLPKEENLAFKILQKQAAEYELSLNGLIVNGLKKYIPEDRFYISVRIYWNPSKMKKVQSKMEGLQKKSGKLPGFPIFINNEEQGIDYYLGAGSVMKLKVEIMLDESLPKHLDQFIYNVVPSQARFVADRGDIIEINRIPFPKSRIKRTVLDLDVPLSMEETGTTVIDAIQKNLSDVANAKPVILHPVLQRYINDYEKFVNDKLSEVTAKYVDRSKFILNVKFYWNADEINKLKRLIVRSDTDGKIKLPGFTIFLEEREPFYEMVASSTNLMRMEVSVMIDDSVSSDVEPFLNKIIPMNVKIIPERGDMLTVYRGHFPQIGVATTITTMPGDKQLITDMDYEREINQAFRDGKYRKGIILVDRQLSRKTRAEDQLIYLKKKGSLHIMLQEKDLAKAAWKKALSINPDDRETMVLMERLK
ncbi:MAG: hypothetical protein OEY59_01255 [Deltaproteobacteria bacterium]|nr:hypothetical protein [Deltaproteobacteria bacterium]